MPSLSHLKVSQISWWYFSALLVCPLPILFFFFKINLFLFSFGHWELILLLEFTSLTISFTCLDFQTYPVYTQFPPPPCGFTFIVLWLSRRDPLWLFFFYSRVDKGRIKLKFGVKMVRKILLTSFLFSSAFEKEDSSGSLLVFGHTGRAWILQLGRWGSGMVSWPSFLRAAPPSCWEETRRDVEREAERKRGKKCVEKGWEM